MSAKQSFVLAIAGMVAAVSSTPVQAAGEVNLYSMRTPSLIQPFLDEFSKDTGIKVNVVHADSGILERLKAEGRNTPADAVLTADFLRIDQIASAGLLQSVKSDVIEKNIPANLRQKDGQWIAFTQRARIAYVSKTRVKEGEIKTYADLANPSLKGRLCTRSGKHPYNIGLLAAMIAEKGEKKAEDWARGLKANLARKPQGNDRAQVKAIKEGVCDVSLGNTYYMGLMQTNEKQPEQKEWAAAVKIVFPTFSGSNGSHVNVSAAGVTKYARNKDNAIKLMEYLSGDKAQQMYADVNFEYPVKPGAPIHPLVKSWGSFDPHMVNLEKVAKNWELATKIMDRVNFDG